MKERDYILPMSSNCYLQMVGLRRTLRSVRGNVSLRSSCCTVWSPAELLKLQNSIRIFTHHGRVLCLFLLPFSICSQSRWCDHCPRPQTLPKYLNIVCCNIFSSRWPYCEWPSTLHCFALFIVAVKPPSFGNWIVTRSTTMQWTDFQALDPDAYVLTTLVNHDLCDQES